MLESLAMKHLKTWEKKEKVERENDSVKRKGQRTSWQVKECTRRTISWYKLENQGIQMNKIWKIPKISQHQLLLPPLGLCLVALWLFTYLFLPPPIFDDDGGEPTVQLNWSSPVLPASSVALTVTSWVPLLSLSYTTGLVQNVNACPSRLHSGSSIPTAFHCFKCYPDVWYGSPTAPATICYLSITPIYCSCNYNIRICSILYCDCKVFFWWVACCIFCAACYNSYLLEMYHLNCNRN